MKRIISVMIVGVALVVAATVTYAVPNIEMVRVKGGCYQMGDTFGGGLANEKPVHQVCVSDFYIGKFVVTQAQWRAVMGDNPSVFKVCGSNCPVETVSYDDALQFIKKLNDQTGKNYRLPYEAEWEYAARSGGKQEKWAGTNNQEELGEYAWFADNSGKTTQRVGRKKPNGLGLYDMTGNVWEWCNDWYAPNYYQNSPEKNPQGPPSGSYRVLRGGGWNGTTGLVRAAYRNGLVTTIRGFNVGFRLILPADQ
jgi:formylglycine-generating enzyme required for sulfatase activity